MNRTGLCGCRIIFDGIDAENMFRSEVVPLPDLSPGEILVRVSRYHITVNSFLFTNLFQVRLASICMSDVHTITGQRTEPTPRLIRYVDFLFRFKIDFDFSVLGHEAVVEVLAHRRPESDLVNGDRLTFSIADCCGKCEFCYSGLNQKCTKLFKVTLSRIRKTMNHRCCLFQYGHAKISDGSGFNGCYATHIILRRGTHVVKIPDIISDRCAAPINCALATTMCAMEFVPKIKNGRAFVQVIIA